MYLLVQVRKLSDRVKYINPNLRMFCNWVVHTDLSKRAEGSTHILTELDFEVAKAQEQGLPLKSSPIFRFETFRESLRAFLVHFGLPLDVVDCEAKWRPFIILYSSIISECPIVFTASKLPLRYISSVELRKYPRLTIIINGVVLPRLRWKLIFQDGKHQYISTWGDKLTIIWSPETPAIVPTPLHALRPER
jgi:hypothetical protein